MNLKYLSILQLFFNKVFQTKHNYCRRLEDKCLILDQIIKIYSAHRPVMKVMYYRNHNFDKDNMSRLFYKLLVYLEVWLSGR